MADKSVFVYVIAQDGNEYVKVGIARCIKTRIATLQIGNPLTLSKAYEFRFPTRDKAQAVEMKAHKILKRVYRGGEWFKCHPHLARRAIERAAVAPQRKARRKVAATGSRSWAVYERLASGAY